MKLINKRPGLVLILLICFAVAFMTFYLRVKSLHQIEVHLQMTVLPYTQESFNTLVQTEEFMRANGHNILAYCDYDQESNKNNDPTYLATFRRRKHHENFSYEDASPLILDVYAHSNIRHSTSNETQTNIVVFVTSSPVSQQQQEEGGIENRIEQFDITSTIGYIDTFCMQFSRKNFGGYTYFLT